MTSRKKIDSIDVGTQESFAKTMTDAAAKAGRSLVLKAS